MKRTLLTSFIALALYYHGTSQIVTGGGAAYLQGAYVEIGISGAGGFEGADTVAYPGPSGLHYRSNTQYFGFVANPQMNGWASFDGDYFTPGTPENGWGIEIVDGSNDIKASNNCAYNLDIPGAFTCYTHSGGVQTLTWEGDFDSLAYSLHITILYTLNDSALNYLTTVTVENLGDPIDEFYYYRNIDPDNNVVLSGSYVTTNTVTAQASAASPFASVKAEQTTPWYSMYSLSATDSMARVTYGGFSNRDASDIWDAIGLIGTPSSDYNDEAISIACKMDSLTFGRAAHSFTFSSAFGSSGVVTSVADTKNESLSIYPNPTNGILNIRSTEPVQSVMVYNAVGVLQFQSQNMSTVDLSGYANGIYLVKVKTAGSSTVNRIVKQ